MNIACGIEYDGTDFFGFQRQKSKARTVQTVLESSISELAAEPIEIICAGRTDRGVHASNQVISFHSNAVRSEYSWVLGLNSLLPKDVRILWAKPVAEDFHARFSALNRRYHYYLYNHRLRPSLFREHISWECRPLNFKDMQEGVKYLEGVHDFSSFRASECQAKSPIRDVELIRLYQQGHIIMLEIKANAFLYHMVRNIVGVLIEVGVGKRPPIWVKQVLESQDRTKAGITARANGLFLVDVGYPKRYNLPEAIDDRLTLVTTQ